MTPKTRYRILRYLRLFIYDLTRSGSIFVIGIVIGVFITSYSLADMFDDKSPIGTVLNHCSNLLEKTKGQGR